MNTKHPYDIKNITPMVKSADSVSDWWQAYNDIMYRRVETNDAGRYNYTKANLKNVLHAMAALYILNRKCYDSLGDGGRPAKEDLISNLLDDELIL